jgi:arylsulfatase A-like enzyme
LTARRLAIAGAVLGLGALAYVLLADRDLVRDREAGLRGRYNVVLVTIDTLRADHLGVYGHSRNTSPVIDRLAEDAVLFENAIVPMAFTGPSHASMLTGLYPQGHGVLNNAYRLLPANRTLAEVLRDEGYRTAAFVAARAILGRGSGFDQGFEVFDEGTSRKRRADEITRQAVGWLRERGDGASFFLWVHYYDVHCDYNAPEPFFQMFASGYTGPIDPRGKCGKPHYNKMELDEEDLAYIRGVYDGEVRYVDQHVGALLKEFDDLGLRERTILILTSDHGESLGERGVIGHNLALHDYEVRVPLIIRHPALEGRRRRVRQQVELVSLMPTVLDLLEVGHDAVLVGESFAPLLVGQEGSGRYAYTQTGPTRGRAQSYGLRGKGWKLLLHPDGEEELYSLGRDGETTSLADEHPELTASLKEILHRWIDAQGGAAAAKTRQVSPETRRELEALGYIEE